MLFHGDCLERLRELESDSLDSLVTDPPAGISFMGKAWDDDKGGRDNWIAWLTEVMRECLRVLKPGAHGLVWAIPRTSHWTMTALENAGFEIRDVVTHLFGTGFPKSLDVSKAIDKAAGATRERGPKKRGGERLARLADGKRDGGGTWGDEVGRDPFTSLPATDAARQWQGYGTALKPACEFWIMVRKPCSEKTVAKNVLKHGTGGINVDGCRIAGAIPQVPQPKIPGGDMLARDTSYAGRNGEMSRAEGRFPANLVLSHSEGCQEECEESCAVRMLDEQSGNLKSGGTGGGGKTFHGTEYKRPTTKMPPSEGGASRFFYVAKASKSDRNRSAKHDREPSPNREVHEPDELFDSTGNAVRGHSA